MRLVVFGLLGLLITACATPQLPITKESHELAAKLQQHNKSLLSWDITASTSLTTNEKSYSLSVFWHQINDQYDLRFDAPFTTGVLKVRGGNGFSEIVVDNEKTFRGVKPEALITEATQFNIPVTGLVSWIRGIPHQNSEHRLDIQGNGDTKRIKQDGWLIEYESWKDVVVGENIYRLPSHITLSQSTLKIRINPTNWVKPEPAESNPFFSDLSF